LKTGDPVLFLGHIVNCFYQFTDVFYVLNVFTIFIGRTFIRGQNAPVEPEVLLEREQKRQKALEHQNAIRLQVTSYNVIT
jgi:hypothetical protein